MSATPDTAGSDRPNFHYRVFGLHIRSELSLPELRAADPGRSAPDVCIRVGSVPDRQASAARFWCADGEVVFRIGGVARYGIRAGDEITVDPAPQSSSRRVRLFLLGSALGALCHQRGLLALHANALVVDGRAIAFAGRSGAGKSTLIAHFHARGYDVLADDTCVLSFDAESRPLAWPGVQHFKLWRDAAEFFGHRCDPAAQVADGLDKYRMPIRPAAEGPFPLACVYVLGDDPERASPQFERITGSRALNALVAHTYRGQYLRPMGLVQRHFAQSLAVLDRVPVYAGFRRRGFDALENQATELERHFRAAAENELVAASRQSPLESAWK